MPPQLSEAAIRAAHDRRLAKMQDGFEEFLVQLVDQLTPEQAAKIAATREKNRRIRALLPGPNCVLLPSN